MKRKRILISSVVAVLFGGIALAAAYSGFAGNGRGGPLSTQPVCQDAYRGRGWALYGTPNNGTISDIPEVCVYNSNGSYSWVIQPAGTGGALFTDPYTPPSGTFTVNGNEKVGAVAVTGNVTTNALVMKGNTEPPVAPGSAWAWYDTAGEVIIVESPAGSGIQFYTGNTLMFNYDQFASLFEVSGVGLTAPSLLTRGTLTVGSAGAANVAVDVPFTATGMEIFPGGAVIGQFEATTPVSVKGGPTTCTYTNSDCRMSGNAVANVSTAMWACACNAGNIYIYGQCGASTCAQTTGISFNGWVTRHN